MNEPIYQIFGFFNNTLHQLVHNRVPVCSLTASQVEAKKISHKYIIENNLIVYGKYDRHGKLTCRVPWSSKPIDEKA